MQKRIEEDTREVKYQCIYRPTREIFEPKMIDVRNRAVYGDFDGAKNDYCYYSTVPNGYGDVWLRQFTGLYDNTDWEQLTEEDRSRWLLSGNLPSEWKGREIYEGDILDISERDSPQYVYFDKEGFYCTEEFALFELNRNKDMIIKVIGNMFEHADLIN